MIDHKNRVALLLNGVIIAQITLFFHVLPHLFNTAKTNGKGTGLKGRKLPLNCIRSVSVLLALQAVLPPPELAAGGLDQQEQAPAV
jgi:hypothetical protein